ncbi:nuclear transport factor 2 family protein [Vineibacter terrae]|uniref:nuclear transport factor 2 family protein n=1 Tax=Vineibacter terrae TaxID=2586908 RepID=UPI002E373E97|nr:nuclear transport factor 2 family protein [Vineibacter terrae]HEX2891856.1 nuclear transport factor 2 family protein [Vineibacter terrae]
MPSMTDTAKAFFDACETGKGWEGCRAYCRPDATFSAQAEPLTDVHLLQQYAEWMRGMLIVLPDGGYRVKSFAADNERNNVCVYAVFSASHTGPGGPVPPTGRKTDTDYVYVMEFDGDKIRHMTKIWHAGWAMRELGWIG